MMATLDTIPKDLPITNPLLFSWIAIMQAAEINIHLSGRQERNFEKMLPAFEYFVRDWKVVCTNNGSTRTAQIQYDVVCALWKQQPNSDCAIELAKNPDGSDLCRPLNVDWLMPFEDWRTRTFHELDLLISGLVYKADAKERNPDNTERSYLAKKFGWEIFNGEVDYFYVSDSTSNKFYGVAGVFTLLGDHFNCCHKLKNDKMIAKHFEDLGFVFQDKPNT